MCVVGEITELLEQGRTEEANKLALSYITNNILLETAATKHIKLELLEQ